MFPTGTARIVQIHPTRRCNLECLHCYSSSGPQVEAELSSTLVLDAISDAKAEGFDVVSFSGGEPLLYAALPSALAHAKALGLRTTMVSNGMLLDHRRLAAIAEHLDLIAISLDGLPESHDLNRNRDGAFTTMLARLKGLRESGVPFGFVFMLTQFNLFELEWVVEFAAAQGAGMVQVHPLSMVGRASQNLHPAHPDGLEFAHGFLEAQRLRSEYLGRVHIQLDLFHQRTLEQHPEAVFALPETEPSDAALLSELISPLVIETDGTVIPLEYGLARRYALGNLHSARLSELARRWPNGGLKAFRSLCRAAHERLMAESEFPFFNWYEEIGRQTQLQTGA